RGAGRQARRRQASGARGSSRGHGCAFAWGLGAGWDGLSGSGRSSGALGREVLLSPRIVECAIDSESIQDLSLTTGRSSGEDLIAQVRRVIARRVTDRVLAVSDLRVRGQ